MLYVRVIISRFVDKHQLGWVECQLTDVQGQKWFFIEKVPVVTTAHLDSESNYPESGVIACEIIEASLYATGSEIVTIDTELPWHIESTSEQTRFTVYRDQLTDS